MEKCVRGGKRLYEGVLALKCRTWIEDAGTAVYSNR